MTPAHNAKILTTGIAIASTLGISTGYAIRANAQILEKIEAAQIAVLTAPAPVATTEVVPPSIPGAATPVTPKAKTKTTTAQQTNGVAAATNTTTIPAVSAPVEIVPPPTTAPATSASK